MFVQCPLNMLNKILTSLGELNNFTLFWDIYDAENFMHNDPILIRYQPALDSKNQKLSAMWRSVTNDSHSIVSPCRLIGLWIPCTGCACVTMLLTKGNWWVLCVIGLLTCYRHNATDIVLFPWLWNALFLTLLAALYLWMKNDSWAAPLIMTDGTLSTNTWLHMSKGEQKFTWLSFRSESVSKNLSGTYMHFISPEDQ